MCLRCGFGGFSRDLDGSDYYSVLNWFFMIIGSNFFFSGSDVVSSDSGYESFINFKFGLR